MIGVDRPLTIIVDSATRAVRESFRTTDPSRVMGPSGSARIASTLDGSRSREATIRRPGRLWTLKYLLRLQHRRPHRFQSRSAQERVARSISRDRTLGSGVDGS